MSFIIDQPVIWIFKMTCIERLGVCNCGTMMSEVSASSTTSLTFTSESAIQNLLLPCLLPGWTLEGIILMCRPCQSFQGDQPISMFIVSSQLVRALLFQVHADFSHAGIIRTNLI